ncbi:3-deoxy-D-manno-octulosonic acid transferase [hydrothermal vent metagenome]|uniref:3-deoxy-D-manno-octulosonic acid transferase n=1 Tax=hydrothermal vent metagenome TaxID=652676 RepID=A0A3B0X295_9ZZZZ
MTYRLLSILLWPVFLIYTLKTSLRDKSFRYFFQRLGFSYPSQKTKTIWIHCASVGEVNTYLPLHHKLLAQYPNTNFVITTNTVTGSSTVLRHKLKHTQHCFLPIESAFAISRFLNAWQPSQVLIMETEIWPLLYKKCHLKNIPISIINARLSHRTLNTNNWIKTLYKTSLSYVGKILCKSKNELNNFKLLGATDKQLSIAGNLKFAFTYNSQTTEPINLNNRKYCVAASTHNNEEEQLAALWNKLDTNILLVIVPRHPNRSKQIQKQLNTLNIKLSIRSKKQNIDKNTRVYLADTLGELAQFMQQAELVIIGGSFIKHGGQNILEPCRIGKPTICGPHMFNFKDEVEFLLQHNGCIQIKDISEIGTIVNEYISAPENLTSIGNNAKNALQKQSVILDDYISSLLSR